MPNVINPVIAWSFGFFTRHHSKILSQKAAVHVLRMLE
jgi:hypothetical protein